MAGHSSAAFNVPPSADEWATDYTDFHGEQPLFFVAFGGEEVGHEEDPCSSVFSMA